MNNKKPDIPGTPVQPDTNWEELFNSKYLRWFHLKGQEFKMTIERVEMEVPMTLPGGIKEKKPVVFFTKGTRPLVLCKTNGNLIVESTGEPSPYKWPGKTITLYQSKTRLGSKTVPCIRIK